MKIVLLIILVVIAIGCDFENERDEPTDNNQRHMSLIAEISFDESDIEAVDDLTEKAAFKYDLQLFEKDKRQMALLNQGEPSFFISLKRNDHTILVLSNVVANDLLDLRVSDSGELTRAELENIVFDVRERLETRFGIAFLDKEEWTAEELKSR